MPHDFREIRDRIEKEFADMLGPDLKANGADRVHIVPVGNPTKESRFNERCAPSHEGVIDPIARRAQPRDEEFRQLRLEAGAVADFMERMGLTLPGGPEFIDQIGNAAIGDVPGGGAETGEGANLGEKIF